MEIIVVLTVIALIIWFVTRSHRSVRKQEPADMHQTHLRVATERVETKIPYPALRTLNPDGCWIPPGQETKIKGCRIPGGMLYVGQGLASVAGHRVEPALIDPSLFANHSDPDRCGGGMTYWPS